MDQEIELLPGQIIRKGRAVTLTSAVHHNRNSPCYILIHCQKKVPVRVTVTPADHEYLPRRDVMPFDAWIDFGILPLSEDKEGFDASRPPMSDWYNREKFLDIFDSWVDRCDLGVSACGVPRRFLPVFCTTHQYQLAKFVVWPKGTLDLWSTAPHRVIETVIAYENDRAWMRGQNPIFTKNTVSQWATKMGFPKDGPLHGPLELDRYAKAYNAAIRKNWV